MHFGHANIIKLTNRPFEDVYKMNDVLVNNWNKIVKGSDEIYILGDLFWSKYDFEIIDYLNGRKYLILGNHDRNWIKYYKGDRFVWIKDYYILKYNKIKYVLFHYPLYSWDGKWHGSIHLYGHVHNSINAYKEPNTYNVGVDVNEFGPVSINAINNSL